MHENKVVQSWRETQSEGVFVYLCIPSTTNTVTIMAQRMNLFPAAEQAIFQDVAPALETVAVSHRDLVNYQMVNKFYLRVRKTDYQ